MLTGSVVSSIQGAPRSSHDVDIAVDLDAVQAGVIERAFPPPEYYVSRSAIEEALKYRRMFNVMENSSGFKVDFWLLKDDPFDQTRFGRRIWATIDGMQVRVSSPEDTILSKLHWAELCGGSEKQFTDVLRVFELQGSKLDLAYINDWVDRLQVRPLWERVQREAEPMG